MKDNKAVLAAVAGAIGQAVIDTLNDVDPKGDVIAKVVGMIVTTGGFDVEFEIEPTEERKRGDHAKG